MSEKKRKKIKPDPDRVLKHLDEKWKDVKACPMCGNNSWTVSDSIFELREYTFGDLVLGGPVLPIIPVTCSNCGNTVLINAIIAGAVDKKKIEERQKNIGDRNE